MSEEWNEALNRIIDMCRPGKFLEFVDDREASWGEMDVAEAASLYGLGPTIALSTVILQRVMELPASEFSSVERDVENLWAEILDRRDTSQLSPEELDKDDVFVEEFETTREAINGILYTLRSYTHDDLPSNITPDALIQEANKNIFSNLEKARTAFGQAGALILRGAPHWMLWHLELGDTLVGNWHRGFIAPYHFLKLSGRYPLASFAEEQAKGAWLFPKETAPQPDEDDDLLEDEKRLMNVLLIEDDKISDEQLAQCPPFTKEILDRLRLVITSDDYASEDSEGKGYAPIRAAKLLGKSHSPEAVDPLVLAIYKGDFEDMLLSAAIFALEELNEIALPYVLDCMRYSSDSEFKGSMCDVLSSIGKGNEEAFRAVEAFYHESDWANDRVIAVMGLAELGDARALPILYKALADRTIDLMGIREVVEAIESLDPNSNRDELQRLKSKAEQRYDSRFVNFDRYGKPRCRDCGELMEKNFLGEWMHVEKPKPAPIVAPLYKNVGRNDPCPCGSGKKYKYCHGSGKMTVN